MKMMTPDELYGISEYIEHFIRAPGVYEKEHMLLGVDEYFAVVNDRYMTIEMVEWSTIRLTIQRVIGLLGIPIFCRGLLIVFDRRGGGR